jgi:hypothetical protein
VDSVQQYNEIVLSVDMVLGLPTGCQSIALARARPEVATSSDSISSRAAPIKLCPVCTSSEISSSNSIVESCENKKGAAAQRGSREKDLKDYAFFKALIDFKVLNQPSSHNRSQVWFLLLAFGIAEQCTYEETQPNPVAVV